MSTDCSREPVTTPLRCRFGSFGDNDQPRLAALFPIAFDRLEDLFFRNAIEVTRSFYHRSSKLLLPAQSGRLRPLGRSFAAAANGNRCLISFAHLSASAESLQERLVA